MDFELSDVDVAWRDKGAAVWRELAGDPAAARVVMGAARGGLLDSAAELLSIAAAVLGGVSLFGGEGRVSGIVVGVVFIIVLQTGMDIIKIQSYLQLVVLGALLVTALIVDRLRTRLQ